MVDRLWHPDMSEVEALELMERGIAEVHAYTHPWPCGKQRIWACRFDAVFGFTGRNRLSHLQFHLDALGCVMPLHCCGFDMSLYTSNSVALQSTILHRFDRQSLSLSLTDSCLTGPVGIGLISRRKPALILQSIKLRAIRGHSGLTGSWRVVPTLVLCFARGRM